MAFYSYEDVLRDQFGRPVPGAYVSVVNNSGGTAELFDAAGVPMSNPFRTDALGGYYFAVKLAGRYIVEFRYGGRKVATASIKIGDEAGDIGYDPNIDYQPGTVGFALDGKAQAAAVGVSGSANNLGTMANPLVADNLSVKDALKGISTSLRGTTALTGMGAVGYNILTAYDEGTGGHELQYTVNVRNFGAVGDGVTDDTNAFRNAISFIKTFYRSRSLYIPSAPVGYRLTSTIEIDASMRIYGEGVAPYIGNAGDRAVSGPGSWLLIDHVGIGIKVGTGVSSAAAISGFGLRNVGFQRPFQPTPTGSSWTPIDNDFDLQLLSTDCIVENIMHLGTCRGIDVDRGNFGRFNGTWISGHFFKIGIQIQRQYDLPMLRGFRAWPYWSLNNIVADFTVSNLRSLRLGRLDNPFFSDIFTIAHNVGIDVVQSVSLGGEYPGGSVNKGKFSNIDLDLGQYGLRVGADVPVCDLDFSGLSIQADNRASAGISHGMDIAGNSARVGIVNFDARFFRGNAIRCVTGTGNSVSMSGRVYVNGFSAEPGSGFPAFEFAIGNTLNMAAWPVIEGNAGTAGTYGGGGEFNTLTAFAGDLSAIQASLSAQGNEIAKLNTDMGLSVATVWNTGSGAAAANKSALIDLAATADAQKKPIHIPPGEWYCDGGMSIPYVPIICDGIIYTNTTTAWLTFTNSAADVNGFYLRGGKFINTNGTTAQKDSRVYRFQATNGKLIDSGYIERIDAYGFYAVCENDCDTFTSGFGQESLMNNFRVSQVRNSWRGALNAKYVFLHKRGSGTGWIYADCLENLAVGSTLTSQPDSAYWDVYGSETMGIPAYVRVESGGVNAVCGDITVEGDLTGRQTAMISIDGNCNYQTKVKLAGQIDAQARYTSVQDPPVASRRFIAFDERVLSGGISDLRKYAAVYLQSTLETKVPRANLFGRFDPISLGAQSLEVAKIKCANAFGPLVTISASGLVQGSAFGRRRQVFSIRWNGSAFEVLEIASLGFTHPASVDANFFLFTASVSGDTVTFSLNLNGNSDGSYAEVMIQTEEGWSLMTRGPSLQ